jgi:hypothetical protein
MFPSLDGMGEGRVNGYGVVTVNRDESGGVTVAFQYDPLLVQKVRTIDGRKCHPLLPVIAMPPERGEEIPKQSQKDYFNNPPFNKGGQGGIFRRPQASNLSQKNIGSDIIPNLDKKRKRGTFITKLDEIALIL